MAKVYIDREAAIEKLNAEAEFAYSDCRGPNARGIEDAIEIIEHIATADVAPVRHGRWLRELYCYPRCSECGSHSMVSGRYCPNCGAKMDGGADDG